MKAKTSPELKSKKQETRGVQPRNRIKYSNIQLHQLEKVFLSTQYPDSCILEELSNSISVSVERLSIWFQNRRSKFKKQSKDGHVTWMRQQLYRQGTPQSRGTKPPAKDSCHVLSPPAQQEVQGQGPTKKPSSNLHYHPNASPLPACSRVTDYDPYSLMTSPPPVSNGSTCYNTPNVSSDFNNSPLLLTHLLNDTTDFHMPYYPTSGYYGQQPFASSGESQYYQSYSPYYNFPSTQMTFPQIGV